MALDETASGERALCHECGTTISPSDPFCGFCGAPQRRESAQGTGAPAGESASPAADSDLIDFDTPTLADKPSEELTPTESAGVIESRVTGASERDQLKETFATEGSRQTGEVELEEQPIAPAPNATMKADTTG